MNGIGRRDVGALMLGLILLAVGVYFVLRNTLGLTLPDIQADQVWPLLVVALGLSVLYREWSRSGGRS
ncbi:MAG: LiaI-LiaF-like domain-containing protein [Candidatus Limnocylindrales bacterium]